MTLPYTQEQLDAMTPEERAAARQVIKGALYKQLAIAAVCIVVIVWALWSLIG